MDRRKIYKQMGTGLCAAWLLCGTWGCEDRIEVGDTLPGGETVEVTVRLGFAPEENAAGQGGETRAGAGTNRRQAFRAELRKEAATRAANVTPDGLYELHILQFDQNGNQLDANGSESGNVYYKAGKTDTGTALPLSLAASHDCQHVIIARGKDVTTPGINGNLAAVQAISFDRDVIDAIPTSGATQEQMNKMPYVLHLKHVKITSDGKLQSPDVETVGANDVRLLLKRLAAKVTVNWNYNVTVDGAEYTLKQLLLQTVPLKFSYVPKPDDDGVYPDIMDQYTTLVVKEDKYVENNQKEGTYSFWAPANVRKDNPAASSPLLRTKDNASPGSSYLTFEAANKDYAKKKFRYRIYIGDENPENFSMKSNTDYIYDMNFKHTTIPASDRRVTYVDPTPASESNDNFVPTANCFMVAPGGSFCFDPFMFRSNGTDAANGVLKDWVSKGSTTSDASVTYGIKYVKLYWQTKEEGDLGEPVMGIVNSESDHTNIVDIKGINRYNLSIPSTTAATAENQCRIYCRVAPGTTGGNGLIAAYDTNNEILWSWHVWVTDYNPDCTGNASVLGDPNKRKLKFNYHNNATNQLPMMDRNLGAMTGYVNTVPESAIEKSKTNGFHYQWGRKDPFPSSYTNDASITSISVSETATKPVKGLLNLYKADGVSYIPFALKKELTTYRDAYQHPQMVYKPVKDGQADIYKAWLLQNEKDTSYPNAWGVTKAVHDPCPAGWRVAQITDYLSLFSDNNFSFNDGMTTAVINIKNGDNNKYVEDGGMLIGYDKASPQNSTFIRFTGYYRSNKFDGIGENSLIWTGSHSGKTDTGGTVKYFSINKEVTTGKIITGGHEQEAIPLRCIQEKAD